VIIKKRRNMHVNRCYNFWRQKCDMILKYKGIIEIQRMWIVKAKVIPVITGATGTISESLRQYLSNISGETEIKELQKAAILGTEHTLRIALM